MRGAEIIVSANPKGTFLEGIIDDTSLPGTLMQINPSGGISAGVGEHHWQAANIGTNGLPLLIAVLLNDVLQGRPVSSAYVAGTKCFLYCPIPGESLNVMCGTGAGTSNTFTMGQRLMVPSAGGILVPVSGSPQSVPFFTLEALAQQAADVLVWCRYTGH